MENRFEDFGKRLNRLVAASNMAHDSQRVIAGRLGVNVAMYNAWLHGKALPTMARAIRIARVLNCCVEYLLTGNGPSRPDEKSLVDISLLEVEDLPARLRQQIAHETESFCKNALASIISEAEKQRFALGHITGKSYADQRR